MRLAGRAALVTGGSRGIGRAVALALAAEGGAVAVNYRQGRALAEAVAAEIISAGGRAVALGADVAEPAQAEGLVKETLDRLGRLDILVNNAGISRDALIAEMTPEACWAVMRTNFGGVFNCTRAAIEPMMRERRGAIVNIASIMADRAWPGQANYAASKGAIVAFSRTAALELARFGVRVNVVAPGLVPTDLVAGWLARRRDDLARRMPLRRLATPEDVARAVVFLASDDAAHITGTVLRVDGGVTARLGLEG